MTRNLSADLLKSIAIFGVVYIHGHSLLGGTYFLSELIENLFRFCVPSFIIMWAYFFEKSYSKRDSKEQKAYLFGRFKHLFGVFLFWSVIYFLITVNWQTVSLKDLITKHFSGYGFAGQYFFIILFQLLLFYPVLQWTYNRKVARFIVLVICIVSYIIRGYFPLLLPEAILKLGDRPFLYWLPYVYVGIALAREQLPKLSIWGVFSLLLIPIEFYWLEIIGTNHSHYITLCVLVSSILTTISVIQSKFSTKHKRIEKLINFTGQNTLTIFVLNPLVIYLLEVGQIGTKVTNSINTYTLPIISCLLVFVFCLILSFSKRWLNKLAPETLGSTN